MFRLFVIANYCFNLSWKYKTFDVVCDSVLGGKSPQEIKFNVANMKMLWVEDIQDIEGLRMITREKIVVVPAPILNKKTNLDFSSLDMCGYKTHS
jgi:hypothetical protein